MIENFSIIQHLGWFIFQFVVLIAFLAPKYSCAILDLTYLSDFSPSFCFSQFDSPFSISSKI